MKRAAVVALSIGSRNGDTNNAAIAGMLDEVAIWDGVELLGIHAEWLAAHSFAPEPTSLLLLGAGLLPLLRRRKSR